MTNNDIAAFLAEHEECRPEGLILDPDGQHWYEVVRLGNGNDGYREQSEAAAHALVESKVMDRLCELGYHTIEIWPPFKNDVHDYGWRINPPISGLDKGRPTRLAALIAAYEAEATNDD